MPTAACFVTGTRVATTRGPVPVEDLAVGDRALTAAGAARPIRWIGHGHLDLRDPDLHAPDPRDPRDDPRLLENAPVRIAAHAFGPGRPARDLLVSPGHAVCVAPADHGAAEGEVLVHARALVNGATVTQETPPTVTYWHVELDAHDLLLAENLPVESYLDTGNRAFFVRTTASRPGPDGARAGTQADFCRPFRAEGPALAGMRRHLWQRALGLGWRPAADPWRDVHVVADGARVAPEARGLSAGFALPSRARGVWLVSAPTGVGAMAGSGDWGDSEGGLEVVGLRLDDGWARPRRIPLDDLLLGEGFLPGVDAASRRTAPRARLHDAFWAGCGAPSVLHVELAAPASRDWTRAPAA